MEYRILYVLFVRCTAKKCAIDLQLHEITEVTDDYIHVGIKAYNRSELMEVESIRFTEDLVILRIPFLKKEAAIVWVREALMMICTKGSPQMKDAARSEWLNIINPDYDQEWFTGGKKVEEWRAEMREIAKDL